MSEANSPSEQSERVKRLVSLPFVVIAGEFCACGKPAKIKCSKVLGPNQHSQPIFCCEDCWENELPQVPEAS